MAESEPEPIAEPEPVMAEEASEPEREPEPEPVLAAFDEPAVEAEPEPVVAEEPEPAPEPEPEPAVEAEPMMAEAPAFDPPSEPGATAAEPAALAAPDVSSTLVAWPSSTRSAGPENGAPAEAGSFEEATSVIPVWQQTDPNADPKRTVSLQALPPEQVASGSGFAALLTFESGPFAGRIVALPNQMVTIGRAPDNDVVVGDPATSGHHGRIDVRGGSFWISDLGSTNGTLVNGEPVIEKQLSDGDTIAIGQSMVRFSLEA